MCGEEGVGEKCKRGAIKGVGEYKGAIFPSFIKAQDWKG